MLRKFSWFRCPSNYHYQCQAACNFTLPLSKESLSIYSYLCRSLKPHFLYPTMISIVGHTNVWQTSGHNKIGFAGVYKCRRGDEVLWYKVRRPTLDCFYAKSSDLNGGRRQQKWGHGALAIYGRNSAFTIVAIRRWPPWVRQKCPGGINNILIFCFILGTEIKALGVLSIVSYSSHRISNRSRAWGSEFFDRHHILFSLLKHGGTAAMTLRSRVQQRGFDPGTRWLLFWWKRTAKTSVCRDFGVY